MVSGKGLRPIGTYFERGVAKQADGKNYTGFVNLVRKSDNANFTLHYGDGVLQKSVKDGELYKLYSAPRVVDSIYSRDVITVGNYGNLSVSKILRFEDDGATSGQLFLRSKHQVPAGFKVNTENSENNLKQNISVISQLGKIVETWSSKFEVDNGQPKVSQFLKNEWGNIVRTRCSKGTPNS